MISFDSPKIISEEKFEVPDNTAHNIFSQDPYHMGTQVAKNVFILHETHPNEVARYIIVVDLTTGEKVKIHFDSVPVSAGEHLRGGV